MKLTRNSVIVSALLASMMTVTACSGGSTAPASPSGQKAAEPAAKAPEPPTEISIYMLQQTPEVLPADNIIVKEIEKKTNTKLNLIWTPTNTNTEKTKITLSSGDIPDLMLITNPSDPLFVTMAQQGAFWDIGPFIKDYKYMNAIPKDAWDNTKTKGKNYGIPRVRPLDGGGNMPMLRKDWLDKLGLKTPETMDDMYQVMKAFTEKDPDGNGKADTVGLTGQVDPDGMGNLLWVEQVFNNAAGNWKLVDGKLVHTVTEKGTRDALEWLNKAYNDKILAQDFAIMKFSQSRDLLMGNKAGVIGSAMNPQWLFTDAIRKIDPKGDMLPVTHMIAPDGKKWATKDAGHFGMYVIPKKVPEAKLKKLLAFMEFGFSDEGSDLANHGIKDVHYVEKDGFKVATEQTKTDMVGANVMGTLYAKFDKYARAFLNGIPKDMYDRNTKIIDERSKISIPNPQEGLISDTWNKLGPDYSKKIQDAKTKVILGKDTLAQWDQFVAGLKADPNWQKITQEMNDAYKNK